MKEVMKRFKPLRRAIILETSGFSYFFNAHSDKLCKNRWEEALFAAFVPTVIRSERCAIQKDAVSFSAHARKSRTTTKHESILITIHFWQETLFNQTNCSDTCANPNRGCNCDKNDKEWREDSGLLTDKTKLPVKQLRFGDTGGTREQGYHTLGKLKCYGIAW